MTRISGALTLDHQRPIVTIDNRYSDVRLIAERGMANGYSVTDNQTGKRVFLKILREAKLNDQLAVEMFEREIEILRELSNHPSQTPVPKLLSSGSWEQRPYFTQPLLNGLTLDQLIRKQRRLNARLILQIIDECLSFLASLHDSGFVHGDISPDNIFLKTDAEQFEDLESSDFSVVLLDYNSSRRIDEPHRKVGDRNVVFLKLPYASPLVALGYPMSAKTDLYSLGVVFFELLVGARPFHDPKTMQEVRDLRSAEIPSIPEDLQVPPTVERAVRWLLQSEPYSGFRSADQCREMLRDATQVMNWISVSEGAITRRYYLPESRDNFITRSFEHSLPEPVRSEILSIISRPITEPYEFTRPEEVSQQVVEKFPIMAAGPITERREVTEPEDISQEVVEKPPVTGSIPITEPREINQHDDPLEMKTAQKISVDVVSAIHAVPIPATGTDGTRSEVDLVDFSVFGPTTVVPEASFILEIWAYTRPDRNQVMDLAGRRGRMLELGSRGPIFVPGRSEITLVLRLDDFELIDSQDTIMWSGDITNVSFIVKTPHGLSPGVYPGQVNILHNGVRLARLIFELTVGKRQEDQGNINASRQEFRSAFASYASADREEVLRRVQGIRATGIDVFVDVLTLRGGQSWEEELYRHIRTRDIFYLFWSSAARDSEWVAREWHYALNEKGLDFIHPIPLVSPDVVPPPEELRSKHFNDIILAVLKSQQVSAILN